MTCGNEYTICCQQYATFSLLVTWQDENGNPVNLTGYNADMQVRLSPGGSLLIELTNSNGRITLGGTAGTINLNIPATQTTSFTPGTYHYDILMTSGAGIATRLLEGTFYVEAGITP